MQPVIIKPINPVLKKYIHYFLFFKKDDDLVLNYTTFPNNNLCLGLYKENTVEHITQSGVNNCIITTGNHKIVSKLYGFHKIPFNVEVKAQLDQVCILFYPAALRAFTNESYQSLSESATAFEEIFQDNNQSALEQIFETEDLYSRAELLESLLLHKLNNDIPAKLSEALWLIANQGNEILTIQVLAQHLKISETSLYRLFTTHLGQNPKAYLKTHRFRQALSALTMASKKMSPDYFYLTQYHDQAHFINDFKVFSGYTPKKLRNKIIVEQKDLAWIYNHHSSE